MAPQTAKAEDTRDRILDAAIRLFNRSGTAAVTTNHVAADLGISPGNLYYHYRNKTDLVRAAFDRMNDEADALWASPFGPAGIDVTRLLQGNMRLFERYAFFGRELPSLLYADLTLKTRYAQITLRRRAEVERSVERLCELGMMVDPGPDARGRLVEACWVLGLFWMGYADISIDAPLPEQVRRGAQLVLEVLRPHLVPGVHALLHGVISSWAPAKKTRVTSRSSPRGD
ncbi:MAG: TetR/AcrR family transcriptional regulator [Polyangiaceae bacterium]